MRKERIKRRIVSMFLVVCMAVGTISVAPKEAKAVDVLSMFDVAGTMVRAGKSAMEQAKKENWSFKDAIGGTFKCIGKELMGLNEDESPGSTVIVNEIDLSGVEAQLAEIQTKLLNNELTLTKLQGTIESNMTSISKELENIKTAITDEAKITRYHSYLSDYWKYYTNFTSAVNSYDEDISSVYTNNSSSEVIKNTYDRMYTLKGKNIISDYETAIETMGLYLCGDYSVGDCTGSLVDILCEYYTLAGYTDAEVAAAVKDFVAQTYYTYSLAHYYYMSIVLYQTTYMAKENLTVYKLEDGTLLDLGLIKTHFVSVLGKYEKTTTRVFYDLNKHFSSLDGLEVSYKGPAGYLTRKMQESRMDVEPGAAITLPDSTSLLAAYFGSKYVQMFGGICEYSYDSSSDGVTVIGDKIVFGSDLEEGTEVPVNIYCTVGDQKMLFHTYTFTCKAGSLAGGYGTYEYPVVIKTEEQFVKFSGGYWNDSYVSLAADLDFADKYFDSVSGQFSGVFYGNGHTIANAEIGGCTYSELGLFKELSGGIVQDLILKNPNIQIAGNSGLCYVGGIAGKASSSKIQRCEIIDGIVSASPNSGYACVGGIVGELRGSQLEGCITRNLGVHVGESGSGSSVSGDLGGIAGYVTSNSKIKYCGKEDGLIWSSCTASESYTGGLVGQGHYSNMDDCWSFVTNEGGTDQFKHSSYNHGSIAGYCNEFKIKTTYVYNGETAKETNYNMIFVGTLRQGRTPEISYVEDFTLSNLGYEYVGMLTNSEEPGHPIRLAPIQVTVDSQNAKTTFYYGQDLITNGLAVRLTRRGAFNSPLIPYDLTTDYSSTEPGRHEVTISTGDIKSGYDVLVARKPHTYVVTRKEATCTEDGYERYECQDTECDDYINDKVNVKVLDATGHTMFHEEASAETCKETGNKEYWHCLSCDKYFLDEAGEQETTLQDVTIPVNDNHTPAKDDGDCTTPVMCEVCGRVAIAASKAHAWSEWTLDEDGRHIRKCTNAGCEKTDEINHVLEHREEVAATCVAAGVREYWYCGVCDRNFADKDGTDELTAEALVIPATGKHTGKTTVTKATMKNNGKTVVKCSVCGKLISSKAIPKIASITLSSTDHTYNGNVRKPVVTIKDSTGKKLGSTAYTLTYSAGRKYVGRYTVTIRFKGNYSGTATKVFTIKPKTTSISGVAAAKNQLTIKWAKQSVQTTGYQLQYSTSSTFARAKTVTIAKPATTSYTASKLLAKKKYYVRIRTYKKVTQNGTTKTYYSNWSSTKSATTK